ncbi:putative type II secretion system protein F [Photobacterium damselae subsp. piscicida]|nr:putative type II secretion system protein F [Photobacterium damselae subsp. piscicida]
MAQLAANKIRYYRWRGVNQGGKKITGVTLGFQEQEVRAQLTEQMIQVKKIKRTNPSTLDKIRNQMKSSDVTAITRQLATMIESGVPIVQALKLMASSHHKAEVRAVLTQVNTQVEAGASLSKALKSSSPLFDNFYCDLVATGEETGYLGQVFVRLATYREKSDAKRCEAMRSEAMRSEAMRSDAKRCEAMRSDAKRCEAMRCEAMRSDAKRCEAMRSDAKRCEAMRSDAKRCEAMRSDAKRCEAMRSDAKRCEAMRSDAKRCEAMRCEKK